MDYLLMHKNFQVAKLNITIGEQKVVINKIFYLENPKHIPIGTLNLKTKTPDKSLLGKWWEERAIQIYRLGLRRILDLRKIPLPHILLLNSLGLSLSDQYWIKPINSQITWSQINFFDNTFSKALGNILLGIDNVDNHGNLCNLANEETILDFKSPDSSTSGYLPKKWYIQDGKRILLKGGTPHYFQETINEVIASYVMKEMDINHVIYSLCYLNNKDYCTCENFVNKDTDFVSAFYLVNMTRKMPEDDSKKYQHFILCYENLGIFNSRKI
jgi:hypothetical protein